MRLPWCRLLLFVRLGNLERVVYQGFTGCAGEVGGGTTWQDVLIGRFFSAARAEEQNTNPCNEEGPCDIEKAGA